jgi:LDH2 family malate/lactate/ureidoglycolate dehydrogenase
MSGGSTPPRGVRVPKAPLAAFCRALLLAAGAPEEHARTVVDHLLEADAMQVRSHGVMRVPQYLDDVAAGTTRPAAVATVTQLAPGRAAVDGNFGFGQVIGMTMAETAVRLARSAGVSFVTGRRMGHSGRIGAYAEAIARAGLVGVVVCSGPRSGHYVAPFGGREGRLATNPFAFAYPVRGDAPVVADFSTSVAPEGAIRSLWHRGLTAPRGALRDALGAPTDDPAALYAEPPGAIQPLGGPVGYRGTALAILVDVLAALLAGDTVEDEQRVGSNLAMLAIAADNAFPELAERMGRYIRSSPPLDPARPVMLPGERERHALRETAEMPVMVDGPTWAAMRKAATAAEIEPPDALRS